MAFHNTYFKNDTYEIMKEWFNSRPSFIFIENDETIAQRNRFIQCLKDVGGFKGLNIELSAIENIYYAQELRELFDKNKDEKVDDDEIEDGLRRIAINYMLKNAAIQKRVNAYIIIKLCCAESEIQYYSSISEDMFQAAQLVLFEYNSDTSESQNKERSPRDLERPSRVNLFRSKSLTSSELDKTKDQNQINEYLSLDTIDKINKSFFKLFGRQNYYFYDILDKRQCMLDFWDLLDPENENEISKGKLIERFQSLALNYMANDEICQKMANSYLQRKIEHAIFVVTNVDPNNQDRELPKFLPKTFVTFRDEKGSHKVCVHDYDYNTDSYNVVFENGEKGKVPQKSLDKLERSIREDEGEDNYTVLIENRFIAQEYALAKAINTNKSLLQIKPAPKNDEGFYIFFGDTYFQFNKRDYYILFNDFLTPQFVGDDLTVVSNCPSALETCRCFFLHLGVAVETHPFLLQLEFREACRTLLSEPEDSMRRILFGPSAQTVLSPDQYVDISILIAVWPESLNRCRILLVTFSSEGRHGPASFKCCGTYTPSNGPWKVDPLTNEYILEDNGNGPEKIFEGKDIILKLQDGHFTILEPDYDHEKNTSGWNTERPIDFIRKSMHLHNFSIDHDAQKVVLDEYFIGEYLP